MKILVDFHHTDLFRSFITLFSEQLGHEVCRPLGREYYDEGYFHISNEKESLGLLSKGNWNPDTWMLPEDVPSHYPVGSDHELWKWCPLDQVGDVDVFIVSSAESRERFLALRANKGKDSAKVIRYIGNEEEVIDDIDKYDAVLCADLPTYQKIKGSKVGVFHYLPPLNSIYLNSEFKKPRTAIKTPIFRNFLNFFYSSPSDITDQLLWREFMYLRKSPTNCLFYLHGLGTPPGIDAFFGIDERKESIHEKMANIKYLRDRDNWPSLDYCSGEILSHSELAQLLSKTSYMWHVKKRDGFGFMIHSAAAMGVAPIVLKGSYEGKTAGNLLIPNLTCIEIDGDSSSDMEKVNSLIDPKSIERLSRNIFCRFRDVVKYSEQRKTLEIAFADLGILH